MVERWDLNDIPDDIYEWTVTSQPPPAGLSVWIAKRAGDDPSPYRTPLPTIVADGQTTRFQAFSHGLDFLDAGFLDVDLVYHPGWQIEHPLVEEGGAAARG